MIEQAIQQWIQYGISKGLVTAEDDIFLRNQMMDLLQLHDWNPPKLSETLPPLDTILATLTEYAAENRLISDTAAARDLLDTRIMGFLTEMPHRVNRRFRSEYRKNPQCATDWFFQYSKDTNYVRAGRIAKDIRWKYPCSYGVLDITVNCSKPEKDPRDIAAAKLQPQHRYPACQLCIENTGFAGTPTHPARQNLRPIPIRIADTDWAFQYSPYGYYPEHCIIFRQEHIPMVIDAAVFEKLFDVLDLLPHYFVGSNADLPIVGGSILSHEHFQGGRYTFAMEKAPMETPFLLPQYPEVQAGIVRWPMSVIRLQSENRTALSAACNCVLSQWRSYTDEDAGIFAQTDGTPHSTVTPIARMRGRAYECDLVLRNNRTTAERPLGIFHPNPTLHHIKKENIGLIEVMGLAVLPARLAKEMPLLEKALYDKTTNPKSVSALSAHADWLCDVRERHPEATAENAAAILRQEIGAVFEQVLHDAGVFKRTAQGKLQFCRFTERLRNNAQ